MIKDLAGRHGFDHPVVIADAGLLSKKNIEDLESEKYEYILGARVRSETAEIKEAILGMSLKNGDVRCIDKENGVSTYLYMLHGLHNNVGT